MLELSEKRITQVVFVIGYSVDSTIRTKQFEIEKVIAPLLEAPTLNSNVPDEFNPQVPRVSAMKNGLSVQFSQVAAQLVIGIDNSNGKPFEVIQNSIVKKVVLFQECVDKIIAPDAQRERGIVLSLGYTAEGTRTSKRDICSFIQSKFLQFPTLGDPASASATVGFKTDENLFITLTVADFEVHQGEVSAAQSASQFIDVMTLPIIEFGIELKIDINSRPLLNIQPQPTDVTQMILARCFDFVSTHANPLMGQ